MKKKIFMLLWTGLIWLIWAKGQGPVTLSNCYKMAEQNYPLIKQRDLVTKTAEYSIENLQKGWLPQLNINGQATYQSAVTTVPIKIPGVNIPTLSKDQYKLYAEVTQPLYDAGQITLQQQMQQANAVVGQQELTVSLYQLKERVNQLFFGILLLDEQLKQTDLLTKDLQLGKDRVEALVKNGTAFKSNADVISAEILKSKQHTIELHSSRKAYTDMLGLFIGKPIEESQALEKPQAINSTAQINRPELGLYEEEKKRLEIQNKLLDTKALPRLNAFVQGGFGRPALDMLSNQFAGYYIGGLKLVWSPSSLYTIKKDRKIIDINRQNLDIQKETFLFNTNLSVKQEDNDIKRYQQLLTTDQEIIELRNKIKITAMAQLENGVISSNDFLREVNDEDQARQNKIIHEIQLLKAQYNVQTTTGNVQ